MLPTGQSYRRENGRKLRNKVTKIFCSQQENVTDGTMLHMGQCYQRDKGRTPRDKVTKILCSQQVNVADGTILLTGQRKNTKGQSD